MILERFLLTDRVAVVTGACATGRAPLLLWVHAFPSI